MHGSNGLVTVNPSYGVKGVASSTNYPEGRSRSATWTDSNGDLWMFGGKTGSSTYKNDMWKYSISTNMWTWISGSDSNNKIGIYGVVGTSSVNYRPSSRANCAYWKDLNGDFWLYGGQGYSSQTTSYPGSLADLWKYSLSTNEWTLIKGNDSTNRPAVYGTQGIANIANTPGSRLTSTSFHDSNGDFYLFGGWGPNGKSCDLWKYSVNTNSWTWLKGSNVANSQGNYGTLGITSSTSYPGAREFAAGAFINGNFYMQGGNGYGTSSTAGYLNDVWKYEVSSNNWTYIGGTSSTAGSYNSISSGTNSISSTNQASKRAAHRMMLNNMGDIYLFGSIDLSYTQTSTLNKNDLWKFFPTTNEWVHLKGGENYNNTNTIWGNLGISHFANTPGARGFANAWTDNNNNQWIFGGVQSNEQERNDLWKYNLTCIPPVAPLLSTTPTNPCIGSSISVSAVGLTSTHIYKLNQNYVSSTSTVNYTIPNSTSSIIILAADSNACGVGAFASSTVNPTNGIIVTPIVLNNTTLCTNSGNYQAAALTTCGTSISGYSNPPVSSLPVGTHVVTWTFFNGGGNTTTATQNITIANDSQPPIAPNLNALSGLCSVTPLVPTAYDSCAGNILGTTSTTFPITTAGTTLVTWSFVDPSGFTSTATQNVTVIQPNVGVSVSGNTITSLNTSASSYQWFNCQNNTLIPNATNIAYSPPQNGIYAVIVTENGCSDTSACTPINGLGIGNFNTISNELQIINYPQHINIIANEAGNLSLYNSIGQVVKLNIHLNKSQSLVIENQSPGIYFLQYTINGRVLNRSVLIQ